MRERGRLASLNLLFGLGEKCASIAASAFRVPLLVRTLGSFDYGLWLATLGLAQTGNLLSLGVPYSVVNLVAGARGRDDDEGVREAVATAVALCSAFALLGLIAFILLANLLPDRMLFGVGHADAAKARAVLGVCAAGLLLTMPLTVLAAALSGCQQQHVVSRWRSLSVLLQVAAMGVAIAAGVRGLVPLAMVMVGFDLASALLLSAWILLNRPVLRFRLSHVRRRLVIPLLSLGGLFLLGDMANAFRYSAGPVVLAFVHGPAVVPTLSVSVALFSAVLALSALPSSVLWPTYAEAVSRREWPWIARAFEASTGLATFSAGLFASAGVVVGQDVVRLWAGPAVAGRWFLLTLLAAWLLGQAVTASAAALLSGLSRNRDLVMVVMLEGLLGAAGAYLLAPRFAAEGVAAAMAAASLLSAIVILPEVVRRSTGQRVALRRAPILLALTIVGVAAGLGVVGRYWSGGLNIGVRVAGGAVLVASGYTAVAWRAVCSAAGRETALRWLSNTFQR